MKAPRFSEPFFPVAGKEVGSDEEMENLEDRSVYRPVRAFEHRRQAFVHVDQPAPVGGFLRHGAVRVYRRSRLRRTGGPDGQFGLRRGQPPFGGLFHHQRGLGRHRGHRGAAEMVRPFLRLHEGRLSGHVRGADRVRAGEYAAQRRVYRQHVGRQPDQLSAGQELALHPLRHFGPAGYRVCR